eukprot:Opistho-2@56930
MDIVEPELLVELCSLLEKDSPPDVAVVERLVIHVGQRTLLELLRQQNFVTADECGRVCAVLRVWVNTRWHADFVGNPDMLKLLEYLLADMERAVPDAERACDGVRVETVLMSQERRSSTSSETNSEVLEFLELQSDPVGVAAALKKIDLEKFKKYHVCGNLLSARRASVSGQCPHVGWGRECESKRTAVQDIQNWSFALSSWVEEVVRQATPQQAKPLVSLLIAVAKESVDRGNLQAAFTIVKGLSDESIAATVQAAVSAGRDGKKLKKLRALADPTDTYKAHSAELEKIPLTVYPIVPFLDAIEIIYHRNAPTSMRMPSEDMSSFGSSGPAEAAEYVDQTVSRITALRELTMLVEKTRTSTTSLASASGVVISSSPPKSLLPGRFSLVQRSGSMEGKASEFFARVTLWRFLKESAV